MTETEIETLKQELLEPSATVYTVQRHCGEAVRQQTMHAYGKMLDAHLLTTGVLGTALMRVNRRYHGATPLSRGRDALFASFVIGMDLCERAIAEGRYLQAHALLRQEMETLAQLKAVEIGARSANRSPNVSRLEDSIKRLYNELSNAAHLAQHDVVRLATEMAGPFEDAPGPTSGTRHYPGFDREVARRSFALHVYLTMRLLEELCADLQSRFGNVLTQREVDAVGVAVELMMEEGMLELDA